MLKFFLSPSTSFMFPDEGEEGYTPSHAATMLQQPLLHDAHPLLIVSGQLSRRLAVHDLQKLFIHFC